MAVGEGECMCVGGRIQESMCFNIESRDFFRQFYTSIKTRIQIFCPSYIKDYLF